MIIVLNSRQLSYVVLYAHYNKHLYNKRLISYDHDDQYYQNMSWIDSNSTTSTEIVNTEHKKFIVTNWNILYR